MRDIIQNWQGTDAELLTALNAKTIKRKIGDGMVTLAMIGDLSVEVASSVNLALETVLAGMPEGTQTELATKSMLKRFLDRLTVSDRGLDFHNDEVRAQLTGLLTLGGIATEVIESVLSLGAVYESIAIQAIGHDATQGDIDAERHAIWASEMRTRANHAAALFADAAEQAENQWDAAEQAAQLASAWEVA